ncbi:hypothetical protein B9Z65_9031 [Elsinoe australis]|uniref:Uncharacterized protein n=1 Tax=Elsinoe australis TaxID=40998 RepID=A0A2P8ABH0_9PEZI|nr:hypothetical protein B9Z65_9031 [Elsinoe australis]
MVSSREFYLAWRFAIEKDFVNAAGKDFEYAPDGERAWGDESRHIKLDKVTKTAVMNSDHSILAAPVGPQIHLFDSNYQSTRVLEMHSQPVSSVHFRPNNPTTLLSTSDESNASLGPIITIWDLSNPTRDPTLTRSDLDHITISATTNITAQLSALSIPLSEENQSHLRASLLSPILQSLTRHTISQHRTLKGRLLTSFQSPIFSPSGDFLLYLPGPRPPSNSDAKWDVKAHSMTAGHDTLTLSGHRDAIMWAGFSPCEKIIGTASWDGTFRIWDAKTGEEKFVFRTEKQNWTGGWAPDGGMFAGTSGDGRVKVWEMEEGREVVDLDCFASWCRTLDWSADGGRLVVGGRGGKMVLVDLGKGEVVQERKLSLSKMVPKEKWDMMGRAFLETSRVQFADGGRKIVFLTSGDASIEVYDLVKGLKWRFERPIPEAGGDESAEIARTLDFQVLDGSSPGGLTILSTDTDGIRVWSLGEADHSVVHDNQDLHDQVEEESTPGRDEL